MANVSIILGGTNPLDLLQPTGSGIIISPTSNDISSTISVNTGVAAGSYYPLIDITSTAQNSGANYYIDPTKSTSRYTYTEVINGISSTPQGSSLNIPVITVQ